MKNILTLMIIIASQSLWAQDTLKVRKYDYVFSVYGGPQFINSKKLNDALVLNGIDKLSNTATLFGMSAMRFKDRLGFGVSVEYMLAGSKSSANRYTTMRGSTAGFHLAYYAIDRKSFSFFPSVGLRTAVMTVRATEKPSAMDANSSDLNNILLQPHRNANIDYKDTMIDLGLNFSFKSRTHNRLRDCPQSDRYILLDVKAGYNFVFNKDNGTYNGVSVSNGPSINYTGPYVRIGFGLASMLTRMNWK